nr:hypothetical protein BaRGS_021857 [Batillaria attramentaria]
MSSTVTASSTTPRQEITDPPTSLFLCHFYIALKYEVYPSVVLENGEILYAFRFTDAYASNMAALDKWALVNKVIFVYVVLLLGLVVNVMLVVALHRHRRSRQEMMTSDDTNIRKRQEREITITILVSSLVFTTLGLPIASNSLAGQVLPPGSYGFFSARCHTFLFVQLVGSTLFALSFSTDFCTFVIFSSAYRVTLRRVLARVVRLEKRVSEKKGAGSSQDYTKNSDISSVETQY